MKRLFATLSVGALLATILLPVLTPRDAIAQCVGVFGSNEVCGNPTAVPAPPTRMPITTSGLPFSAPNYGWKCDSTDHSTQALALLTTVANAGGGTIFFPPCPQAMFTATGSGTNLTVSAVASGTITPGMTIYATSGISSPTTIVSQTSGTTGGAGVYVTSGSTTVSAAAVVGKLAYRADSQLLIPNDGATGQPHQVNFGFVCAGGSQNWYTNPGNLGYTNDAGLVAPSAAVIDLRFQSGNQNGKIESRGLGALFIQGCEFVDNSSTNATPFIHDTNTTMTIRDNSFVGSGNVGQDAIVLGGTSATIDGSLNAAFQGYPTTIDNNHFTNLNRGVYGRTFVNNLTVINNSFQGNVGTRAIEFDGTVSALSASGNFGEFVANNTIEMDVYTYGIVLSSTGQSVFINNGFYDSGGGNLSMFRLVDANSGGNTFICGWTPSANGGSGVHDAFQDVSGLALQSTSIYGNCNGNWPLVLPGGSNLAASLRVQNSTSDPTTKFDGDLWYNTPVLNFQIAGTTNKVLLSAQPVALTPANNTTPFSISGGSTTGSNTNIIGMSVTGTLNTTGVVDGAIAFANITVSQTPGAGSSLLDWQVGGTSYFKVPYTVNPTLDIGSQFAMFSDQANSGVIFNPSNGGNIYIGSSGLANIPILRGAGVVWLGDVVGGNPPVAQTLQAQAAAGTNISGVNETIVGSISTGTGTSGDMIFQTGVKNGGSNSTLGTATTAFTLKGETQQAKFAGQIISTTGTPTIGSGACGASTNGAVVAGSTNQSGQITIGASATTTCTISWSATLPTAPNACVFFPMNATAAATGTTVARAGAPSTSSVVLSGSALANANYAYVCL